MAQRSIERVGLIGLGKMGRPMARHLVQKGFSVAAFDVSPEAHSVARAVGARLLGSPREVAAASDLVLVVVGFDDEAEEVIFAADGLLAGAAPGLTIAICSTIAPASMLDFAARLEGSPVALIDAPLCRGEGAAEAGKLLLMGGGDEAVFASCRPAFAAFAEEIFHLGAIGAGQVGKMVNNLILWTCISGNAEGFALGARLGVAPDRLRAALVKSSACNWALETQAQLQPMPWAEKDMTIVLQEADAAHLSLPLCGVVKEVVKGVKLSLGQTSPKPRRRRSVVAALGALLLALGLGSAARAQEAYGARDRISVIIGYEAGGGYDQYARFIAPMLSKQLPGHPTVVPQNMPGAGSLKAANFVYNVAPKDGSVVAVIGQGVPLMQVFGQKGIQFEASRFGWIGRMSDAASLIGVWHKSPALTITDTKRIETTIAVGGALSGSVLYVQFLDALAGTKLKPIEGYSSNLAYLAMERGEVDGSSSLLWPVMQAEHPDWIAERKVRFLVQAGLDRLPALPDVPLIQELVSSDEDRTIMRVVSSSDIIGRALLAPPDLPPARLALLRRAFDAAMTDPEALALAGRMKLDINPLSGARLTQVVEDYDKLSPTVLKKIREIAGIKAGE